MFVSFPSSIKLYLSPNSILGKSKSQISPFIVKLICASVFFSLSKIGA